MTFGGLKETSESMENNEAKTENTEKKRNQILEIPDEYKDDFDKKIETSENKEQQTDTEKKDTPEGGEKTGWFEKIKGFFSKEKENNIEKEDEPEKSEKPDKHSSFIDSLKVDMSPEGLNEKKHLKMKIHVGRHMIHQKKTRKIQQMILCRRL